MLHFDFLLRQALHMWLSLNKFKLCLKQLEIKRHFNNSWHVLIWHSIAYQWIHTSETTEPDCVYLYKTYFKSLVCSQIACYLLTPVTLAQCCTASLTTLVYLGQNFPFCACGILQSYHRLVVWRMPLDNLSTSVGSRIIFRSTGCMFVIELAYQPRFFELRNIKKWIHYNILQPYYNHCSILSISGHGRLVGTDSSRACRQKWGIALCPSGILGREQFSASVQGTSRLSRPTPKELCDPFSSSLHSFEFNQRMGTHKNSTWTQHELNKNSTRTHLRFLFSTAGPLSFFAGVWRAKTGRRRRSGCFLCFGSERFCPALLDLPEGLPDIGTLRRTSTFVAELLRKLVLTYQSWQVSIRDLWQTSVHICEEQTSVLESHCLIWRELFHVHT